MFNKKKNQKQSSGTSSASISSKSPSERRFADLVNEVKNNSLYSFSKEELEGLSREQIEHLATVQLNKVALEQQVKPREFLTRGKMGGESKTISSRVKMSVAKGNISVSAEKGLYNF